jgi:ABC-type antimicrobial peptide transport system permease subunit
MKFFELVKFSFLNLWRRKLRTSLTVLGVMIGTASIVVMMSLGIGLNKQFMDQIQNSATLTLITINSYGGDMMYVDGVATSDGGAEQLTLTRDVIDGFGSMDHVKEASPVYNFDIYAKSGSYESNLWVTAMTYDMLEALKLPVLEGAMPERGAPFSLMVGRMSAFDFHDPSSNVWVDYWSDPDAVPPVDLMQDSVFGVYDTNAYWNWQSGMGDAPKKYLIETSAILGVAEQGMYSQYDYNAYADLEAVEALFQRVFKKDPWPNQQVNSKGKPVVPMAYNQAYVLVDDMENVAAVQNQITEMGFQAYSEMDYLKSMQEQSRMIQYVLGGIGSVSLIVAAIGITNTMLMSIFERTKEIGIFKVLGCSLPNIRSMFLCEAALIGFSGGMVGLGLSYGLSFVINVLLEDISYIPPWLSLAGLGIAVAVGMISGIVPALRAMKLSALEAIRSL